MFNQQQRIDPQTMRNFIEMRGIVWKHLGIYAENGPINTSDPKIVAEVELATNLAIQEINKKHVLLNDGAVVNTCQMHTKNGKITIGLG